MKNNLENQPKFIYVHLLYTRELEFDIFCVWQVAGLPIIDLIMTRCKTSRAYNQEQSNIPTKYLDIIWH